jgi:glycosyltransferase involved in cell wall biosynthesis
MSKVKCLIYERDAAGHRLHHVRHLAEALLDVGCEVVVSLQSDVRSRDEFKVHLQHLEAQIQLRTNLNPEHKPDYFSVARRVDEVVEATRAERPDWVYIPYADMLTQAAAVRAVLHGGRDLRATPIEGQIMRGRYAYPDKSLPGRLGSSVRRWLTRRSPWRVTHVLDPWVFDKLRGTGRTTEFRLIPDPINPLPDLDRADARRKLGIPTDGRYIATAGVLDERKGLDLLLAAFAQANLHQDDRMLMVGQMDKALGQLIAREYGTLLKTRRLIIVDGYVRDFDMECCYLAADVIVAPHPRVPGSSGTLIRGAAAKRPIIASDYGWMGWATQTFELGEAVDFSNQETYVAAIETALRNAPSWRQGDKAARFCQYHTTKNQQAHWLVSIARERGVATGDYANRIEWNWVMGACDKNTKPPETLCEV